MAFIYDLTDTWNAGGTTFNAIKMNVTDTASAAASKLVTLQVGGSERFGVDKTGIASFAGVVRGPAGTTSAPAFSVTSDTNTGMWFPAADTIAFSEGGVEAMRLDSAGRVAIGTTTPNAAAQLEVASTTRAFLPPRMTTAQRDAIASPPDGSVLYNSTIGALEVRQGGAWVNPTTAGQVNTPPSLETDFQNEFYTSRRTARAFSQLINFTRTTAATFVGSNGLIQTTPQSRNLLTFTEEFDNSNWAKTNVTIIPNQNPAAATLGSELVTNGDFASGSTGWTDITGAWAVTSGALAGTSVSAGAFGPYSNGVATAGRVYLATFTITVTSGSLLMRVGNTESSGYSVSGTYSQYFVAASSAATIFQVRAGGTGFTGTIDNISVRELVGGALQAPDGTNTADTILATAGAGNHHAQQSAATVTGNSTLSVFVRAGTSSFVQILMTAGTGTNAWFTAIANLSTGAITQSAAGASASLISSSITNAGGGWYRVSVTGNSTLGVVPRIALVNAASGLTFDGGGNVSWTAAGTETAFIWGAQLEAVPDANLVLGSELRGSGVVSTVGTPSPIATYNSTTGDATLNRVDGSNVSGIRVPVGGSGRSIRVSVTITATTGTVQVRGNGLAGTILGVVGSTAGTYVLYVVSDTTDIYLTMSANATTASITINSVKEITGTVGMPSDYTRNFGGLFPPRFDYDPVTLAPRGLLIEEQRTNRTLRSEDFTVSPWAAATSGTSTRVNDGAPLGFTRGLITATSANGGIRQIHSGLTSGQVYALSFYIQSTATSVQIVFENGTSQFGSGHNVTINPSNGTAGVLTGFTSVSIQPFGPGYVYTLITAAAGGALAANIEWRITNSGNSIWLGRPQFEAGAFATSYIPTVASQVTRNADVATISAPNFASWFNQTEGTMVVSASRPAIGTADTISATLFIDGNNIIELFVKNTDSRVLAVAGGATQVNLIDAGKVSAGVPYTSGVAYRLNDYALATNAGTVLTDTSATIPTVTSLGIGSRSGGLPFNGHIRSIRYYPTRLSNAQLQALTA